MTDRSLGRTAGRHARRTEFSADYSPVVPDAVPALVKDRDAGADAERSEVGGEIDGGIGHRRPAYKVPAVPGPMFDDGGESYAEASEGVQRGTLSALPLETAPVTVGNQAGLGLGTLPRPGVSDRLASADAFRSSDVPRPGGPTRGSAGAAEALAARAADVARRLGMAAGPTASLRALAEGTDDAFVAALAELVAHQPSTSTAGDRVTARGQAALAQLLTRTGGVLGPEDAVRRIGVTREALRLWRADHRVLAFARADGAFVYPMAQFTAGVAGEESLAPVPGLRRVLPLVLAARRTPMAAFTWMAVRRTSLGDDASGATARSVFEALAAGDLEQVSTYTRLALRAEAHETDDAGAASTAVPPTGHGSPDARDPVRDAEDAAAVATLTDLFMRRLDGDEEPARTASRSATAGGGRGRRAATRGVPAERPGTASPARTGVAAETSRKVAAKSRTSSAGKAAGGKKGAKTAGQGAGKTSEKATARPAGTRRARAQAAREV